MITNVTRLAVKAGERLYQFYCEPDSPLDEAYNVISMMANEVSRRLEEAKKASETKESEQGCCSGEC